jgi:hypothetical protein
MRRTKIDYADTRAQKSRYAFRNFAVLAGTVVYILALTSGPVWLQAIVGVSSVIGIAVGLFWLIRKAVKGAVR